MHPENKQDKKQREGEIPQRNEPGRQGHQQPGREGGHQSGRFGEEKQKNR